MLCIFQLCIMRRYFYRLNVLNSCKVINGHDYNILKNQLEDDEVLIGLFDRIIFKMAPLIHSQEDFNEFWAQYVSGDLISYKFYAVPNEVIEKNIKNFIF